MTSAFLCGGRTFDQNEANHPKSLIVAQISIKCLFQVCKIQQRLRFLLKVISIWQINEENCGDRKRLSLRIQRKCQFLFICIFDIKMRTTSWGVLYFFYTEMLRLYPSCLHFFFWMKNAKVTHPNEVSKFALASFPHFVKRLARKEKKKTFCCPFTFTGCEREGEQSATLEFVVVVSF